MTNLDSIFKSRDITLPTKVHLVKAMVFPVVMYRCESWTIKKAKHRRIDAFELWCWRRLLRVPWTARRSNQSTKGDRSWVFFGRTDAKAETSVLWLPDEKNWLLGKYSDEAWHAAVPGFTKSWTWLRDWTELNWSLTKLLCHSFPDKGLYSPNYGFSCGHV